MSLGTVMDDTSSPDADPSFLASSASSILGVKGPLRFRPHGSNQKAHVILRRVTLSDDSGDNSEFSTVIRFSLFAQKRIEVKPGKEILLTVASEDGKFGDLPIVFEGDRATPQASEENSCSLPADEEKKGPVNSRVSQMMPPRMRRAWTKKIEVSPSIEELCLPPTARTSVGVQAEPAYVHSCVQTQGTDDPTVNESNSTHGSGNLAAAASLSPGTSAATHSPNPGRYVSLKVQTDSDLWMTEAAGLAVKSVCVPMTDELTAVNQASEVGRSLSPMELDSMPSSRHSSSSPTVSPKKIGAVTPNATPHKRKNLPPPSPTSSIASSSGGQDMQLSPVVSRSSSTAVKATESVPFVVASQTSSHDPTPFVGSQHIHTQRPTASQTSSHYLRADTESQKPVMAYSLDSLQRNQQKQHTALASSPAIPGSKSMSPIASSTLSTSLPSDQGVEYSPQDPLFNPSSIPPEDWQSYPNIAQLFGVSTGIYSNAVASSSKVTLERAHNSHNTLDSVNGEPTASVRASERSPATPAHGINGTSHRMAYNSASMEGQSLGREVKGYVAFNSPLTNTSPLPSSGTSQLSHPGNVSMLDADVKQKQEQPSVPQIAPDNTATLVGFDSTVTSWLSPFDDHFWDADGVPGLTASHNRKSYAESQNTDNNPLRAGEQVPLSSSSVDSVHPQWPQPQSIKGENLSNLSTFQNVLNGSTPSCVVGAPTVRSEASIDQSHTGTASASPSAEQYKATLGTIDVACRPCPAKPSASPGPRGVKRERPPSPKVALPLGEISDTVDGSPEHKHLWQDLRRRNWPVLKNDHSATLDGEGNLAVQTIAFSSDGSHFALACADKTLRIWNNAKRAEIARLLHNSPIVNVTWLEGDIGVVTLGEDGIVGKWTRVGGNYWQWAKIVDACEKGTQETTNLAYYRDRIGVPFPDKTCLAYYRDRIAVSFPKTGVKMWVWLKGTWQAQRSIVRPNVTAIKFVDDGAALLGGTRDGVLWYCEVPNGTLRAYSFLRDEITSLDMSPSGSHVLVGQIGGRARLVSTRQTGNRGAVEVSYSLKEKAQQPDDIHSGYPGAIFAAAGQVVLYGAEDGCALVWDRSKATVSYGLEHDKDDVIQAVSCIDAQTNRNGWIVTGTRQGQLSWWTQTTDSQKRVKMG